MYWSWSRQSNRYHPEDQAEGYSVWGIGNKVLEEHFQHLIKPQLLVNELFGQTAMSHVSKSTTIFILFKYELFFQKTKCKGYHSSNLFCDIQ